MDAGTPEIEVDAGNGPSEMDAGVVLPFVVTALRIHNGEDDDGNDIDYDSCTNSCNYGKVIIYDPLVPFTDSNRFRIVSLWHFGNRVHNELYQNWCRLIILFLPMKT